ALEQALASSRLRRSGLRPWSRSLLLSAQGRTGDQRILRSPVPRPAAGTPKETLPDRPPAAGVGKEADASAGVSGAADRPGTRRLPPRHYRWIRRHLQSTDAGGHRRYGGVWAEVKQSRVATSTGRFRAPIGRFQ